ncbi:MAG: ABC transporter permease [Deltaproteobacteria bacterium]|nr:ABC transporter permease [Deltaproteobacteria bacterium]
MGRMGLFLTTALFSFVFPPFYMTQTIRRIDFIGTRSLLLIVFTGAFTGMVVAALEVMAISPVKYLVSPILLASILTFPLLNAIFVVVGVYGGYLVGVQLLGVSAGAYFTQMSNAVTSDDVWTSFYKALSFGVIVSWVCCYKGFFADRGAEGVSRATTQAVVMCSVLILVWDYFLGSIL